MFVFWCLGCFVGGWGNDDVMGFLMFVFERLLLLVLFDIVGDNIEKVLFLVELIKLNEMVEWFGEW